MTPTNLYIDRPRLVNIIMQRDTTPKLDFALYEDAAHTDATDLDGLTFEASFAADHLTAPTLSFADADIERNPEDGQTNVVRIPITRALSIDTTKLAANGAWEMFMTDASGHRRRLMKGSYTMEA